AVWAMTAVFLFLGTCVCGLAALNTAYARAAAVQAAEREFALLRAVGASRWEIQGLGLLHSALVGRAGGVLGMLLAWAGGWAPGKVANARLVDLSLPAGDLFRWPTWVWVGGLSVGVIAAVLGAWIPSRRAALLAPVQLLTSS